MSDLKHYLEVNSIFGKTILMIGIVFSAIGAIAMLVMLFSTGSVFFLDFMDIFVILPFVLMASFCIWALRKSNASFPNWWSSLTEAQQIDYLQDFGSAQQALGDFMRMGERYVFIHRIGQPIAYADIQDVYFRRSKNGTMMFVILQNGRRMATGLPAFVSRTAAADLLLQHSCNFNTDYSDYNYNTFNTFF